MSYLDLLSLAGMMLSIDGCLLAAYMFPAALVASAMRLKRVPADLFFLWFLGVIFAVLAPGYSDTIVQARFPYVFIFCFGIVGVGFAMAGFAAICFAPSVFAFLCKIPARRLFLAVNLAMVFPFGPVILFYFVFRDYKKMLATITGASPTPQPISELSPAAPVADNVADVDQPSQPLETDQPGEPEKSTDGEEKCN